MALLTNFVDFVWPEQRAKDPFANRAKSLWQTIEELDDFENITRDAFDIPQVYTACQIYGNAMGSLNFSTFKREGERNEEQEGHYLTKLLTERVNSYMTTFDWKNLMMFHWGITGNAISAIVRNRKNEPVELLPIDPHEIVEVKLEKGVKIWVIGANKLEIKDDDMFHISGPGWDGVMGRNPIEAHRSVIMTSKHLNTFIESFFVNGAHLKHVLETDNILDDDEYNNLTTSWHEMYAGPQNAGKTVILENGVKIKPVSLNPADAAYLQISGNITKTVANIYRLPLYLFNEFKEGAQYENVESQDLAFIKYAIGPMTIKWEEEIKRKLLPRNSKFFGRFDLFSLARGDMKSVSEYANRFFVVGALNQDEMRERFLGMNPLPNDQGKRYYVQGNNMVPIDKVDQLYDQKLSGQPGDQQEEIDTDLPTIKEN